MATPGEAARQQLARLLALAAEARERGDLNEAELFTTAAARCLVRLSAEEQTPPTAPSEAARPVAQQQEQIQPEDDTDQEPK